MDTVTIDTRLSQPAKEFLHQPSRLLIDGKLIEAASGKTFPVAVSNPKCNRAA